MTIGLFSGPVQILALYFVLVALAYIESDGFRQQASLLVSLPYLTLGFCTMNLTMPEKKRYLTTIWLLLTAVSSYLASTKRSIPQWTLLIMSLGKAAYLLTFVDCVKRVWNEFAISLFVYYAAFIRFIGLLFLLLCSSVILINEFANRIHGFTYYIILLEYMAHPLMFLANEMAF
ncbi:unnamed protein product [Onchocerca ochengi]|uniref:Mannosyltransferase n=1 Tax=Onchocerca ochengi TaxID=42157 RepID=A0A182EJS9_ONCOC|nr:unnamed protein product [Onchocerca ochengi]